MWHEEKYHCCPFDLADIKALSGNEERRLALVQRKIYSCGEHSLKEEYTLVSIFTTLLLSWEKELKRGTLEKKEESSGSKEGSKHLGKDLANSIPLTFAFIFFIVVYLRSDYEL